MMDYVEIEVRATNEAAREILDHSIKAIGNEQMREIDPAI